MNWIIYKTTNKINGKYYFGKHLNGSSDPYEFDGYLGSGILLNRAIKKYGKEFFERETLYVCNDETEANSLEVLVINEGKIKDKSLCMNIANGGNGGNTNKFKTEAQKQQIYNDIERNKKLSSKLREYYSVESNRNKTSNVLKLKYDTDKEYYEKIVRAAQKRSTDEQWLEKTRKNNRKKKNSLEFSEKCRAKIKDYYENETSEQKLSRIENQKKSANTTDRKIKRDKFSENRRNDKLYAEEQSIRMKEWWAKRKAAKLQNNTQVNDNVNL
jgi:hypothetical protein